MIDYSAFLDDDILAFIDKINSFYSPDAIGLPIEENRRMYDVMCAAMRRPRPSTVTSSDHVARSGFGEVPVRFYERNGLPAADGAVVLYFHGGGFILGGLDSHDDICAEICDATGLCVVSVDYRLAPEHRHPAAFEDALTAFSWTRKVLRKPVLLMGESAGGNLAACLAVKARGDTGLMGQVLVYPALSGLRDGLSFQRHAQAPLLAAADIGAYDAMRSSGGRDAEDERFTPFAARSFFGLPPTSVFAAECDPLASEGEDYCARIAEAGGTATFVEEKGLVHGYLRARTTASRARDAFDRILREVRRLSGDTVTPAR